MLMIKTFKVLFFIIVIITCIILGLWQIDRANEKAYIYHAFNERISKNPIQFEVIKLVLISLINSSFLIIKYLIRKQGMKSLVRCYLMIKLY